MTADKMKLTQKLALRYISARLNILSLVSVHKASESAFKLFCTPQQRAPKKQSAIFEKGEPLSFRQEGYTIRGHRWLPAGTPLKKVLIVHGFESASWNFDSYIAPLLEKGYEVLAFDAPAHGESSGKQITLPLYIETLKLIRQKYGPIRSYMGHSLGGLALGFFLEETPHDRDTRLVLVAPAVEALRAAKHFCRLLHLGPEILQAMDGIVQGISGHTFAWYSLRRALHQIKADVLYLQDEDDRITTYREALPVKEDGNPNTRFVFTKGLGHRKIYKDPAIREQIVAFL